MLKISIYIFSLTSNEASNERSFVGNFLICIHMDSKILDKTKIKNNLMKYKNETSPSKLFGQKRNYEINIYFS